MGSVSRSCRDSYLPLALISLAFTLLSFLGSACLLSGDCFGCEGKGRILMEKPKIIRTLIYKSGCCESWWESKENGYSIDCGICGSKGRISRLKRWSLFGRTPTYEVTGYRVEELPPE